MKIKVFSILKFPFCYPFAREYIRYGVKNKWVKKFKIEQANKVGQRQAGEFFENWFSMIIEVSAWNYSSSNFLLGIRGRMLDRDAEEINKETVE